MKKIILNVLSILGLKQTFYIKRKKIKLFYHLHIKNLINLFVISQNLDYKSIPIIITSFNQLFYLEQLVTFLQKYNYKKIIIIDNNSTYQPLLDYFNTIESTVTIHRLNENFGHLVFWKNIELYKKYSKGYYIVTDADIVPVQECPEDFVLHFKKILDKNLLITKVGFSLKIDDIPESNPNKQKVIDWEKQFWRNQNKEGDYITLIDTTFALYRANYQYNENDFFKAVRTQEPYHVRHGGWYLDAKNLTKEQVYYFETCNESSSWRIDNMGNLKNKELL